MIYRLWKYPNKKIKTYFEKEKLGYTATYYIADEYNTIFYKKCDDCYIHEDGRSIVHKEHCDFVKVMTEEDLFLELL